MRARRAPWTKALKALTTLAGAAALTLDVHPALTQTPFDLYRERVAMTAAGVRCRLFDSATSAALAAGADQARTAALRAGYDIDALDRGAADARAQVERMGCAAPRLQKAAASARAGYRAYSGLERMAFPGAVGAWRADRIMPQQSAAWRLAQDAWAGEDKVVFGVAGQGGSEAVTLSVAPADGAVPYGARLLLRDPARLAEPILPADGGAPLSARVPIRAAAKVILADARAPADPALRPKGATKAVAFRFPAAARQALEGLDPREAVSVEILYPSAQGEVVRTAFLEVGDFDAGVAFLSARR
ncbi:MAG TPA: hypothetical protein VGM25_17010 [Caulobacteraceae bacterium]|jgi:hypothetical protein